MKLLLKKIKEIFKVSLKEKKYIEKKNKLSFATLKS